MEGSTGGTASELQARKPRNTVHLQQGVRFGAATCTKQGQTLLFKSWGLPAQYCVLHSMRTSLQRVPDIHWVL